MALPAARGRGVDSAYIPHGRGRRCAFPSTGATDGCSPNVMANGTGIVRVGDNIRVHPARGCFPEAPPLVTGSPNVFINGKAAGRLGDKYGDQAFITSGSRNVRIN